MSIDRHFEKLLRVLDPDEAALDQGLQRAERVGRILSNDPALGVHRARIGGSCAKRTAIAPLKDVDLFVYLDESTWRRADGVTYQPHTVLRQFHKRLERTFTRLIEAGDVTLRRQDHSIRVRYVKEGSVAIDVVPALWPNRNQAEIIKIPERSSRGWRETCVLRQSRLIDKYDSPNHFLRRGIRLLKHWRGRHKLDLPSYALELLGIHAVRRTDTKHPRAVFLGVLEWIVSTEFRDPIYLTDYVSAAAHRPPRGAEMVILDAAIAGNNVVRELGAGDRRRIVSAARHSLERIRAAGHHFGFSRQRESGVAFRAAFARKATPTARKTRAVKLAGSTSPRSPAPTPARKRGLLGWLLG